MSTPLITTHQVGHEWRHIPLFKELSVGIFPQDRIGVIGPNGGGKSTLLKILAQSLIPDQGEVIYQTGICTGYVSQEHEFEEMPIEQLAAKSSKQEDPLLHARTRLSQLGFEDLSVLPSKLSGGWQKRLALAIEWVKEPDVLLLDEPTNHLDLESIEWLEKFLDKAPFAYIVTSHDRTFLDNVTDTTWEINRCYPAGFFAYSAPYSQFMEIREDYLSGEAATLSGMQSTLRRELEWLKQSPKARTTKSSSRVQRAEELERLHREKKQRLKKQAVSLGFASSGRQTKKLLVGKNLSAERGGKGLFEKLDLILSPGTRIALVGKNGTGKSTLLQLLLKKMEPTEGTIKWADDLKMVYFDQHKKVLNPKTTLREALAPSSDTIYYDGKSIHVNSWCERFLFPKHFLDLPVGKLSGGERARIHIANLMLEPADVLLLDEPTNDLDIETVEILEENLNHFTGSVVFISHDRSLIDNIATEVIELGEEKTPRRFADYEQWKSRSIQKVKAEQKPKDKPTKKVSLSYKEKKFLEELPKLIQEKEEEIFALEKRLLDHPEELQEICNTLHAAQEKLNELFHKWEELEHKHLGL